MGAEHFYKKYVQDMKKENPCCPLCHREFEQEQEVRELILEVCMGFKRLCVCVYYILGV